MNIIGIGGLPRSGKDTLADFLMKKGYFGFSFGDFTRMHARKRHADKPDPISVENMTETSNWLRETYGPDVILQTALKEFEAKQADWAAYKGLVLYSVRAPVEVDWILAHRGKLVWVETSDQLRYERAMDHLREGEPKISKEEFLSQEKLQWQPQPGIPAEAQMNVEYVKEHASVVIKNESNDIDEFLTRARKVMEL